MNNFLVLTACGLSLVAFAMYNKEIITGRNYTPFSGWALFSLITFVNAVTYLDWTSHWSYAALLIMECFVATMTAVIVLVRSRWRVRLRNWEIWVVASSAGCLAWWIIFDDPSESHFLNLLAYTIAFIPIYRDVLDDPAEEPSVPWFLWAVAFFLNLLVLSMDQKTAVMDFSAPGIYFFHHAAIAVLSCRTPSTS